MNREQAKEILALYRPGIDDPAEAEVAAALELCKQDPELARWFEEQSALYTATRRKFKAVPVPDRLLERILATAPQARQWWRSPLLWAAAAAILLFVGVTTLLRGEREYSFVAWRSKMVRTAMRNYDMPLMTNDVGVI